MVTGFLQTTIPDYPAYGVVGARASANDTFTRGLWVTAPEGGVYAARFGWITAPTNPSAVGAISTISNKSSTKVAPSGFIENRIIGWRFSGDDSSLLITEGMEVPLFMTGSFWVISPTAVKQNDKVYCSIVDGTIVQSSDSNSQVTNFSYDTDTTGVQLVKIITFNPQATDVTVAGAGK